MAAAEEQITFKVFYLLCLPLGYFPRKAPHNGFMKNWRALQEWDWDVAQELATGKEYRGESFSPLPVLQHHFSWQNYHPLFLLAALLQAVCVKNHHFFVKLF